jgi:hypothetical protein
LSARRTGRLLVADATALAGLPAVAALGTRFETVTPPSPAAMSIALSLARPLFFVVVLCFVW